MSKIEKPDNAGVKKRGKPDSRVNVPPTKHHFPEGVGMLVKIHVNDVEILLVIMENDVPPLLWKSVYGQVSDVDVNSCTPEAFFNICLLCVFAIFPYADALIKEIANDNDIDSVDLNGSLDSRRVLVEKLDSKFGGSTGSFQMETNALFGNDSYRCGGSRPLTNWETRVYT